MIKLTCTGLILFVLLVLLGTGFIGKDKLVIDNSESLRNPSSVKMVEDNGAIRQEVEIQTPINNIVSTEALRSNSLKEIEKLISDLAIQYGVNPQTALRIAKCESQLNQYAKNPTSSASGVFQFTRGTWKYIGAVGSPFDAEENIKQFMIHYPKHPGWWVCK